MKTSAAIETPEMNESAAELAQASAPVPDTRPPVTAKELGAAADAHTALAQQIAELEALLPATARDFDVCSATCDLGDKAALNEISRLQVLMAILPKRIEARQNEYLESARKLCDLNGRFIHHTLGPRQRALSSKAAQEVRKFISKIISDEFLINRAVAQSDAVLAVNGLYATWNGQPAPELAAAEVYRILGSWAILQEYEKISASAIKQAGAMGYSEAFEKQMKKQNEMLATLRESWHQTADEARAKALPQSAA